MKLCRQATAAALSLTAVMCLAAEIPSGPFMCHAAQTYNEDDELLTYGDYIFKDGFNFIFSSKEKNEVHVKSFPKLNSSADIVVPEKVGSLTVTGIEPYAAYSEYVKSVVLPDTINYIGESAFEGCGLTSVNIPDGVKVISSKAFFNCKNLSSVSLPDQIAVIAVDAFQGTKFTIPARFTSKILDPENEVTLGNWSCIKRPSPEYPYVSLDVKKYVGADRGIFLPVTINGYPVDSFSADVFSECRPVSIIVPKEYSNIDMTMYNYPELVNLIFEAPKAKIRGDISETSIQSISLPVDSYGDNSIKLPKGLKDVSFNGSGSLNIGKDCFSGLTELSSITVSKSYEDIQLNQGCFENTGIYNIDMGAPCFIANAAFANCKKLVNVRFSAGAYINKGAFSGCEQLRTIEVNGAFEMVHNTFRECPNLENVIFDLNSQVNCFGFDGCRSLRRINNIPVYDSSDCDFDLRLKKYVLSNFNGVEDVGFINDYVTGNVRKIVKEVTNKNMTEMEKVKALHDWVCENTSYTSGDTRPLKYHSDSSVFMNDSTVCDGYAKLCNLLFHEAGIETYCVAGLDHAWNIVKIGGQYFHLDSTWDDQQGGYDWFLRSDGQLCNTDTAHSVWNFFELSSLHDFQGSKMPQCRYSMGDVNMDGVINTADFVAATRCILGSDTPSPSSAVLFDVNYDGKIDVYDTVNMRRLVLTNS